MIEEFYQRVDFSGQNSSHGGFSFSDGVFKSGKILFEGGIDPILRGFLITAVKRPHRMTPAITEKMFGRSFLHNLFLKLQLWERYLSQKTMILIVGTVDFWTNGSIFLHIFGRTFGSCLTFSMCLSIFIPIPSYNYVAWVLSMIF